MALVDYFLKIDGIQGESQDSKHKNEIQLESWSWGEQQSGSFAALGGGGVGKVQMGDFQFVKVMDQSDPNLAKACATGQHIPTATLTARRAGGSQQEYLIIKLSDVLVSSYQTGGSNSGEALPTSQVSLNFAKISQTYNAQKADGTPGGSVKFEYDQKQNAAAA